MSWPSFFNWLASGEITAASTSVSRRCDSIPNIPVIDQFGKSHLFFDDFVANGNAIIVNSMYTTCRGSCPGTSATLSQLRKKLWPVFNKQLTFLSFTLEPDVDRPDVLKSYAKLFGADRLSDNLCDWFFLMGKKSDIDKLRRGISNSR